jgi:hypothetical protein
MRVALLTNPKIILWLSWVESHLRAAYHQQGLKTLPKEHYLRILVSGTCRLAVVLWRVRYRLCAYATRPPVRVRLFDGKQRGFRWTRVAALRLWALVGVSF